MPDPTTSDILGKLWQLAGLDPAALGRIELPGEGPILASSFRVADAAQASIGAATLAAAEIHRRRGGPTQRASVERRHAMLEFHSERYIALDGAEAPARWNNIAVVYKCRDGRWVRLHTNFPHHRDRVLALLGCAGERAAGAAALAQQDAFIFEQDAAEAGACVSAMRSQDEWDAHPQGMAITSLPPLQITKIGEAPPIPLPLLGARPLSGVRVLDLTRVIAGPVCGRTLAAHGADVLHISAAHLPSFDDLLPDTGRGKRTAALDLRAAEGQARLRTLAAGADVFLQGYRPGAIANHGFAPPALAALRPGIICTSLSAYGEVGPWGGRRGFDSLVQTASGFNHAEAVAAGADPNDAAPRVLPCQALDHASGFLLAFGTLAALLRRAEEGGSWLVRVSLAGTGAWLRGLGRVPGDWSLKEPKLGDLADLTETTASGFGRLTALRHSGVLPQTPPHWTLPAMPLGSHPAVWAE